MLVTDSLNDTGGGFGDGGILVSEWEAYDGDGEGAGYGYSYSENCDNQFEGYGYGHGFGGWHDGTGQGGGCCV
jgi:hypothetical protein